MTQPLLASQSNLRFFECNDINKTTVNLNQFTLIRAEKTKIGSCWAQIFCASCIRDGNIRLVVENKQTKNGEVITIHYDYEKDIKSDLKRIVEAFRTVSNQPGEPSDT